MFTGGPITLTWPSRAMGLTRATFPDRVIAEHEVDMVSTAYNQRVLADIVAYRGIPADFLQRQLILSSIYMESGRADAFVAAVNAVYRYFHNYEPSRQSPTENLLSVAIFFNISVFSFESRNYDQAMQFLRNSILIFNDVEEHSGAEAAQYYNLLGEALEDLAQTVMMPFRWSRPSALNSINIEVPEIVHGFFEKLKNGSIKLDKIDWGSNSERDAFAVALDLRRRGKYAASLQTYADGVSARGLVSFATLRGMYKAIVASTYVVSALELIAGVGQSRESNPDYGPPSVDNLGVDHEKLYRPFREELDYLDKNMRTSGEAVNFMRDVSGNPHFALLRPIEVVMGEWNNQPAISLRQQLHLPHRQ